MKKRITKKQGQEVQSRLSVLEAEVTAIGADLRSLLGEPGASSISQILVSISRLKEIVLGRTETYESYWDLAHAIYPQAAWIIGEGRWATICECAENITIELFETRAEAAAEKREIDRNSCRSHSSLPCLRSTGHHLVDLGRMK